MALPVGEDHVIVVIARNEAKHILKSLHTQKFLNEKVVNRAITALGWTQGTFEAVQGPYTKLVWLLWPKSRRFPDIVFPCIGQHYTPPYEFQDSEDESEDEPSDHVTPQGESEGLPQVPGEVAYIVTRGFLNAPEREVHRPGEQDDTLASVDQTSAQGTS